MKLRRPLTITSRTSSITNSFVRALIPCIEPSKEEYALALAVLGMTPEELSCVYCGNARTDWDHLRPLVRDGRPTGYINEIRNLVPSCGHCNQSKGRSHWRDWMLGDARGSPKTRRIQDLAERMERLFCQHILTLKEDKRAEYPGSVLSTIFSRALTKT